jgi:putative membrane protein
MVTMSRRTYLGTASAVLALAAAPLGALSSQTPTGTVPIKKPPVVGQPAPTVPSPTSPTSTTTNPNGSSRAEVAADSLFIRDAVNGSSLEIRLGTLAQEKGSSSGVKEFARRTVADHTRMRDQWRELAGRNEVNTTLSLDPAAEEAATRMATLSGADFDRAYLSQTVSAHQADIAKFQQASQSADAPDVRQLAANALPVLERHLSQAQQLASRVDGPGVATGNPNPADTNDRDHNRDRNRDRTGNGNDRDVAAADRQYVNEVSVGHLMEVRLAEMAQQKAQDGDVKRLANRLHDDFSKWLERWTALNGREPHMGKLHQEKIDRLEKANRKQFDRTYLDIVVENINSMIPYFQKEGRDAKSPKVRSLVNDELPVLRENLQAAQRLERQAQASR